MHESTFNPKQQEKDFSSKIVAGLERVSEVFKILLWEKAKLVGLSPIQIQILIFIAFHKQNLCNVSHLAKEFNVTKPTVSDAIKVLDNKGLIIKNFSSSDNRSYSISLSELGNDIVSQTNDFSNPLTKQVNSFSRSELESLFGTLSQLIYKLNRNGILSVQRTCYGCKFYEKNKKLDYCNLLQKELLRQEIRLDCPEFENR
ncbi:MAG: MarR family transcriptional regulator [Flavobacteriaceae bacterium]|jgi:DNA-binding MarR family transcriptional regulator|uniref:MarR family winged helix-turn-helix transcriptional regulator n=1 Tax=Winogradskyella poriferorum TaxID=307627 RepID=UPI000C6279BB|nr:MarR family transcriptional regulator [Flavobacteriaceae bacterium]MBD10766.1 MarR family transcriptional regulator [Flavobacteriaceae bacterium]|tara:strand:+ start:2224 stop:2826 length:603 start_codon:yes stop_codon:yes gene_type:complete